MKLCQNDFLTLNKHLSRRVCCLMTALVKVVLDLITELDQAVRAVHSCNSWFHILNRPINTLYIMPSRGGTKLFSLDFLRKWRNNEDIPEIKHRIRHKEGKYTRKIIMIFLIVISGNKRSDTNKIKA